MPQLISDAERYELDRLEEIEAADRGAAERAAEREHEFRLAKLKYSTAGRFRMWARVLVAFAKAPAWLALALVLRGDAPEHWKKFLEL